MSKHGRLRLALYLLKLARCYLCFFGGVKCWYSVEVGLVTSYSVASLRGRLTTIELAGLLYGKRHHIEVQLTPFEDVCFSFINMYSLLSDCTTQSSVQLSASLSVGAQ